METNKVVALNIDVDDWDKYIGYMASDYRDIWINHYDLEYTEEFDTDTDYCTLLELNEEYKLAKSLLLTGKIDYIVVRCDID